MKAIIFILAFAATTAVAQNPHQLAILTDANMMAAGFLNADSKTITAYTHPKIVQLMGGADKMEAALKKSSGIRFIDITFGKPSALVTSGSELQCVLPQTTTFQLPQGTVKGTSSLIAFSFDGGKRWVFADTQPGIDKMRQVIPSISRKLVIPVRQQPSLIKS